MFSPKQNLVTAGRLRGSLRKLVMLTQVQLQAFLGGNRISVLIKSMGSRPTAA